MKKIILASASPRRKELLTQAGIPFEVIVSETEERITKEAPGEVVMELAAAKARAVAAKLCTDAVVIGADTVVAVDGKILGKPADEEDAARMLRTLSGREHQVYTGVAILTGEGSAAYEDNACCESSATREDNVCCEDSSSRKGSSSLGRSSFCENVFYEETHVEMYPMTEEEIQNYIATGEPMDKAGAYGIQGRAAVYIKGIRGDYNTVVGLPVSRVYQELKAWLADAS